MAAAAAQERLHAVLRTGLMSYWEWNLEGQQVRYSREWCQQTGGGDSDRVASIDLWEDHLHPADRHRVLGALHHALDGPGSRFSSSYRLVSGDGLELHVLGRWSVVRRQTGEPSNVLAVEVDLTDRIPAMSVQRDLDTNPAPRR